MKCLENLKENYSRNGFVIIKGVLSKLEVEILRNQILLNFEKRLAIDKNIDDKDIDDKDIKNISEQLRPTELFENLPDVIQIQLNEKIINAARQIFNNNFHYVNDIHIQRNTKLNNGVGGWHIDAGSNYSLKYLNNLLGLKEYNFGKIGIYFQSNSCPVGGSIDVIPKTHRIGRIARSILLRLFESKFNIFISKFISKIGLAWLVGARRLDEVIEAGDCVIFDCRLIHRSSAPINISKYKNISYEDKLTLYWEIGDDNSVSKFLLNDLVRALAHENLEIPSKNKPFSNYLSLKFPEDYPSWYVSKIISNNINIANFKNYRDLNIAKLIYKNSNKNIE
jgi:hypothetical protein